MKHFFELHAWQIVVIIRKVEDLAIENFRCNREAVIGKRTIAHMGAAMGITGIEHQDITLLYAQALSVEGKFTLAFTDDAEDVMVMGMICEWLQYASICSAFSLEKWQR